ncbi:dTDP-4-dehydrorhamnose reductase [Serratia proteamaculans]|uniref:dTDP-4-dehydrorhamnose reductase n=1 Tax=Serratia proteamaculans TaxID=28151 RepID=A0A5Q2V696_SERPR|nr:dTDP-4-dehydrorhamnose reductase [Serratia proteamaculans]QGH59726.1 dTDP-4-dehydrorhamnose reductase [Serratia proteamaculans]
MRILVTGGNGQLGRCLADALPANWQIVRLNRQQLDVTDLSSVQATVSELKVDFIVNAAAYTLVDKAEQDIAAAEAANIIGPANLAAIAEINNIPIIHVSTDYVFSGAGDEVSLCENAPTEPLNIYGRTKLLGEQAVMTANSRAVVIRTSWLFSEHGNSFVHTMLKLGVERESLSIINDQFGRPTYAGDLAQCIYTIIQQGINESKLYHFCGDRRVSWFEFAKEIFAQAKSIDKRYDSLTLLSINSEQYQCLAVRPKNAILNCEKIYNERGIYSSDWQIGLGKVVPFIISQMNN